MPPPPRSLPAECLTHSLLNPPEPAALHAIRPGCYTTPLAPLNLSPGSRLARLPDPAEWLGLGDQAAAPPWQRQVTVAAPGQECLPRGHVRPGRVPGDHTEALTVRYPPALTRGTLLVHKSHIRAQPARAAFPGTSLCQADGSLEPGHMGQGH